MDIKKIFELFNSEDKGEGAAYIDLSEHPVVYMGMFKKLIYNYETFSEQLIQFFNSSNENLDTNDVKRAGESMVYNRAFEHLEKLDLGNPVHVECIEEYSDPVFFRALSKSLRYFEEAEEYEKCAFIQKVLNFF
jgi:hypothetical protein